jgi:hypothetical protein
MATWPAKALWHMRFDNTDGLMAPYAGPFDVAAVLGEKRRDV